MINKNRFLTGVLFIFLLSLTGCDFIYRLLQREGAEEKDLIGTTIPYEANPKVVEVQKLLALYGYKPGGVDGGLGPYTRIAIEKFQTDNGIKPSRFVDYVTWEKLHIFDASGLVVEGEVDPKAVQQALKNAGFNPGKVDGKMGPQTLEGIKKFQKAMSLKPDGRIGFKTLRELYDFLPVPDAK